MRHPKAAGQRVVQISALEDGEQRQRYLTLGGVLDLLVFRPVLRLFHVNPDPDAKPKPATRPGSAYRASHSPYAKLRADRTGSRTPARTRQSPATTLAALRTSARASGPARIPSPAPRRSHSRAHSCPAARGSNRKVKGRREPGKWVHRIPQDRNHQAVPASQRSANQPEAVAPPSRMTKVTEKTGHFDDRNVKLLRDRRQQ